MTTHHNLNFILLKHVLASTLHKNILLQVKKKIKKKILPYRSCMYETDYTYSIL